MCQQFISCLCLKIKKKTLQTPTSPKIHEMLYRLWSFWETAAPNQTFSVTTPRPSRRPAAMPRVPSARLDAEKVSLATAANLYWPVGCVCCRCANAVPAVSNTSWGICWNQVNIYECCCCGLFLNGIWLLRCLSEWWRQEARGWRRGRLEKRGKRNVEEECLC